MLKYRLLIIFVLTLVFANAGCGNKKKDVTITGTVTVAGKTVDRGMIQFIPVNQNSFEGGGLITNGKFIATVPYGELNVRFRGTEYLQKDAQGNPLGGKSERDEASGQTVETMPPVKQIIPDKYWFESDVNVTIKTGKETFDFNLAEK
ncbi:MAG: hypothetical protein LBU65_04365 [Planctomycetaceae bacterium]|jgi:hypothetical protein|nr:hypothetical protein [Planctomycetaceae bacterium]